jgi:alpha-mannosidase
MHGDDPVVAGPGPIRDVHVVPHTHWDREWYAPFQVFRLKLVDLVDELVPRLECGEAGPHFLLDGQLAAIDDYLELRPDMAPRLTALVVAGRLAVGPWYVLPDEFLVSGETLVRDLQLGLRRGATFGGVMEVGYLPDMFGHIAQMPQILRLAGFSRAVVWRGVPASVQSTSFGWRAPDGSTVRAEYLPEGYGNGAYLPTDPAELVTAVDAFVTTHGGLLSGPVLWMNGTDHQEPARHLVATLDAANRAQHDYRFTVVSLAEHFGNGSAEALPVHDGEMRSGARANLLMGVTSNRVDVRTAAARAEVALERVTEPMCALFTDADRWPSAALEVAWREVIRSAAHDSVCACSHDDVVHTVLHRYAEARDIADTLVERALYWFGCTLADKGTAVCNTTARSRRAIVETPAGCTSVVVPAFGWRVVPDALPSPDHAPVIVDDDGTTLTNGQIAIVVDATNGSFSIDGHRGLGRLVDGGDEGDTYNWCPPERDVIVDVPISTSVSVLDRHIARAAIAIDRAYAIPRRVLDGGRVEPTEGSIRTILELRAGESFVRVTIEVDNVWRDHRLRLELPLPVATERSEAECAFTTVVRGLDAEGGPTELALPTYPARRFVRAGSLVAAFDAVTEYELVDIGGADGEGRAAHGLAITVLRSTGMLSRGPMTTRPLPAGPELPLEGAQLQTHAVRRFAIGSGDVDPYELADAFVPFPTVRAPGGGDRPDTGTTLQVRGAEVSAVHREGDALLVRAYNPGIQPTVLTIDRNGRVVDLRGGDLGAFDGRLELGPHEIVTLLLSGA